MSGEWIWHSLANGYCTKLCQILQTDVMKIRNNFSSLPNVASLVAKASCTFSLSTVSEEFVCKELKRIKTSKSTGLANIPESFLKDDCNALAKPMAILWIDHLQKGAIPSDWKHPMVTPVFKVG